MTAPENFVPDPKVLERIKALPIDTLAICEGDVTKWKKVGDDQWVCGCCNATCDDVGFAHEAQFFGNPDFFDIAAWFLRPDNIAVNVLSGKEVAYNVHQEP